MFDCGICGEMCFVCIGFVMGKNIIVRWFGGMLIKAQRAIEFVLAFFSVAP